jgi:hypothetical protein
MVAYLLSTAEKRALPRCISSPTTSPQQDTALNLGHIVESSTIVAALAASVRSSRSRRARGQLLFFTSRSGNMDNRTWVRTSNVIGIVAIVALIYWVFTFIAIQVFGLRVFKENLTEIFFMSIFGILALMSGALMVNIMFNLTRIAERHPLDAAAVSPRKTDRGRRLAFAASFPVILALLFAGDHLSTWKKKEVLTVGAQSLVAAYPTQMAQLVDYRFEREWVVHAVDTLKLYRRMNWNGNSPEIEIIAADALNNARVFLGFSSYIRDYEEKQEPYPLKKQNFIRKITSKEHAYLTRVFDEGAQDIRFSAYNGNYELFYPYRENGKTIILYFHERARYGKIGS